MIGRLRAEIKAHAAVWAKANDHRFNVPRNFEAHSFDERLGFGQQVFAVVFFFGHSVARPIGRFP